jgi:hypothetical protein
MQRLSGKRPHFIAAGVVVGGLPLLQFIVLFLQLTAARNAGHPYSGDGIGWAIMSVVAFGLALLSMLIGLAYFGYKRKRYQRRPQPWHSIALAWVAIEVTLPILYFAFF